MPLPRPIHPSIFRRISLFQWITLGFLVTFIISLSTLLRIFYLAHTNLVPTTGGTYIEGAVGEIHPLNPWFTVTNDVNRDIVSLIFAGLLKYNPETKQIEEDLATLEESSDGYRYTLRLQEGLTWHDSTPQDPHYVTADDVLFTFRTVQDSKFPNSLLRQNFRGVALEKIDDRTVLFKLDEPYAFFPSNLTLGLLPERAFTGVPVERMDQTLDFGFQPIGAGPYMFKGLVQTELSTEVTLERFPRNIAPAYHLERVVFRIFPDYTTLLSDLRNLHGVRLVPRNEEGEPLIPHRFHPITYTLPQYVALFLNHDRPILQDQTLRLALQLGTNKQEIVDALQETLIVDTPLLEIDMKNWRYQHDPVAAQGALFTSNWHLPEKVRLQRLLEIREANETGPLLIEPIAYLETGAILTVSGSIANMAFTGSTINGHPLFVNPTDTGAWIAQLPTEGTGSLTLGLNLVRLVDGSGTIVDSFYIWRTNEWGLFRRATHEQELLEKFIASREGQLPPDACVTVADFSLEEGMLRERRPDEETNIRTNDTGQRLELTLLTSPSPPEYRTVAEQIAQQWRPLGVAVHTEIPETRAVFEERMLSRDYDVLLFGQSLLDNLDSYPYWHSSNRQKQTANRNELVLDAYNLSQYASLEADALLEYVRRVRDPAEHQRVLTELKEQLTEDVPAIFLYSPIYTFAYHQNLHGVALGDLSMHSDRFLTLHNWYFREDRVFEPGIGWMSFFPWVFGLRT